MSCYKHFKHYYDPVDRLDIEWKHSVSKGYLTISEVSELSGFNKSYIYRLVSENAIRSSLEDNTRQVRWNHFIKWYSHLFKTPSSPIGEASYSLYGIMDFTGMGRCWTLKMLERNHVRVYHVGWLCRYNKEDVDKAWLTESIPTKRWISVEDASTHFNIESRDLYYAIARHRIRVKRVNGELMICYKDIKDRKETLL